MYNVNSDGLALLATSAAVTPDGCLSAGRSGRQPDRGLVKDISEVHKKLALQI